MGTAITVVLWAFGVVVALCLVATVVWVAAMGVDRLLRRPGGADPPSA